jgi:hypothetical protein
MSRRAMPAFAVCLLALVVSASPAPIEAQAARDQPRATAPLAGTATLTGRVESGAGCQRLPVRRARVTLRSDEFAQPFTADTDTEGRYRFDRLPAGTFRVVAEKAGFVSASPAPPGVPAAMAPPPSIAIRAGQTLTLDLPMHRAAAIEGRIVRSTGEPAVNVLVSASRLKYTPAGKRPFAIRQVRTDDQGRFRIHTLPAGDYYVDVAIDPLNASPEPLAQGELPAGFARTYFPGTARIEDARMMTLQPGEEVRNADFAVTMLRMSPLRGKVLDASGKTLTSYSLRLQPVGAPAGDLRAFMLPEDGTFQYDAVPPGQYWLMSAAVPSPGAPAEAAAMRIDVDGRPLNDLVVRLAPGARVVGRIETDDGSAVPAGLQIALQGTQFDMPVPAAAKPPIVQADGSFLLEGIIGTRTVGLGGLPAGWAMRQVEMNGADVTDAPIEFAAADSRSLRVVLTRATATVAGAVMRAGAPVPHARVVVFSTDERRWGAGSRVVQSVEASPDGRYAIDSLLPGDYLVVAVPYLDDGFWQDVAVLRALKPLASPVTVGPREQLALTLQVKGMS